MQIRTSALLGLLTVGVGAFASGCSSDDHHARDAGLAGVDCTNLVRVGSGYDVFKGCIYEFPEGSHIDVVSNQDVRAVWADGGIADRWQECACNHVPDAQVSASSVTFDVIPQGADPTTWSNTATISTVGYDHSCQTVHDCQGVYAGSVDGLCFCATSAISASALDQYNADFNRLRQGGVFGGIYCSCPIFTIISCEQGLCTSRPNPDL